MCDLNVSIVISKRGQIYKEEISITLNIALC